MANTYANAYKEVLIVINNLSKEDYEKIPEKYIEYLENNCNEDYKFEYDTSKSFNEQELLDDTKYILFGLFEKFGATEQQKEKIKAFKANYTNRLELQKREKYNYDNLFKNNNEIVIEEETLIEVKGKKWYEKIFSFFRKIFVKKS